MLLIKGVVKKNISQVNSRSNENEIATFFNMMRVMAKWLFQLFIKRKITIFKITAILFLLYFAFNRGKYCNRNCFWYSYLFLGGQKILKYMFIQTVRKCWYCSKEKCALQRVQMILLKLINEIFSMGTRYLNFQQTIEH